MKPHPTQMVRDAAAMRKNRYSYGAIARALWKHYGVHVGESTVRDWVTYRKRSVGQEAT